MIDRQIEMAAAMAQWIDNSYEFALVAPQSLTAVAFQLNMPEATLDELKEANRAIVDKVNHCGQRWLSMTTVAGRSAIRMMVISYLTEDRHIRELQIALKSAAAEVLDSLTLQNHNSIHELIGSY